MSLKKTTYFFGCIVFVILLVKFYHKEYRTFCHAGKVELTIWENKLIFGRYLSVVPPQKNYLEIDLFPAWEFSELCISLSSDSILRIFSNTPFLHYDLSETEFKRIDLIIDSKVKSTRQWRNEYDLYYNPYSDEIQVSMHGYIDHHHFVFSYMNKINDSTICIGDYSPRFIGSGYSYWEDTLYLDLHQNDFREHSLSQQY